MKERQHHKAQAIASQVRYVDIKTQKIKKYIYILFI